MAAALAWAGSARAANYYVSQAGGSDANPGTAAAPWKTLSKASGRAAAGDSILVLPGAYSDPASDPFRAFNPPGSGRAGAPIVFKSAVRHQAVLTSLSRNHPAMGINNRQFVVIDGFKVVGGIGFRERADNGILRNCDVSLGFIQQGDVSLHWGIYLAGSSRCLVEDNRVHSPGGFGNRTHNGAALMVIGVPAPCENNLIRNNEADGGGIWYNAFGQKAGLIAGNTWLRNVARNAVTGFLGMGSTDNTKYSVGNRFRENLILGCRNAFELDHHCTGFRIHGNTARGCAVFLHGGYRPDAESGIRGTEVWNNIFAPAAGAGNFYQRDVKAPDWKAFLAYSDHNGIQGRPAAWNYGSASLAALEAWRSASGLDSHSLSSDPRFRDPDRGDFRLAPGSAYAHAGTSRTGADASPGYAGLPPDPGIHPRPGENAPVGPAWAAPDGKDRPPPPVNLPAREYDPIPDSL